MGTFQVKVGKAVYEVDAPDENTAWKWATQEHYKDHPELTPKAARPEPSLAQKAIGAGEAALGTIAGGAAGALGTVIGTGKGLAQNIAQGTYGTQKGAEQMQQAQEQTAQQFAKPFMPSTQTGQEYMGNVAETLAPLQAFPMMSEWDQIATLAKAARPTAMVKTAQASQGVKKAAQAIPTPKIAPTIAEGTAEAAQAAEKLGIPVMTTDIAKPQTFIGKSAQMAGERIPFAGTGGMRETQQAQRVQAIKDVAQEFKADSPLPDLESSVMNDLAKTRGNEVSKYSNMKKEIFNKTSGQVLETPKANMAIDTEIASLKSLNSPSVQPVIDKLESFKGSIQGQDINNVERLRKILGEDFKNPDLVSVRGEGERAVSKIYGALKEDMGDHIKQFGDRRDLTKWNVANKKLSIMMGELENNALKYTLKKGNVTPEVITRMIYSKKPSDTQLLFKNLSPEGKQNARSAVLGKIYQDSLDAEGQVSTAKFLSNLDKMDENTKSFFKGEDRAKLEGLKKALALTKRAEESKLITPTGQQLYPAAMAGAAGAAGGIAGLFGLGTVGLIARIYESAPIRNALLRMSKASTTQEKSHALETLQKAIEKNQGGKF